MIRVANTFFLFVNFVHVGVCHAEALNLEGGSNLSFFFFYGFCSFLIVGSFLLQDCETIPPQFLPVLSRFQLLHLNLLSVKNTWNMFWHEVLRMDLTLFSSPWLARVPILYIAWLNFSPLISGAYKLWVHFWTLYSILLICWCGRVLGLYSFNYHNFIINFGIWWGPPKPFFVSSLFLLFHLNIRIILTSLKKKPINVLICISLNNKGNQLIFWSLGSIFLGGKGHGRAGEENRFSFVLNISMHDQSLQSCLILLPPCGL